MSNKLQKQVQIKDNGIMTVKLFNEVHGTIGRTFKCKQNNLFLIENSTNSPERKFTISIRNDGDREFEGKYRMGQISFLTEEDLRLIRDGIDQLLSSAHSLHNNGVGYKNLDIKLDYKINKTKLITQDELSEYIKGLAEIGCNNQ